MAEKQPILVILGPTASGKSSLAMSVARQVKGEILSVDSMQVYQSMDIGTAKPNEAEQKEIRHHLIDCVSPTESFSVANFVERADAVIADCTARNVPLIATGGTPLYYKALFEGLFEGPSANAELRGRLDAQTNESLHEQLTNADPAAATRIHVADRRRLIRALEVFELTGQPISALQQEWESQNPHRHPAIWIGMAWDKDELNRRINARVKQMIAAGWLEEVRNLLEKYPQLSMTAGEATGYRELIQHVRGKMSLDDAVEQIKIGTRQLARRQMKWFKRFTGVNWITGKDSVQDNTIRAMEFWNHPQ